MKQLCTRMAFAICIGTAMLYACKESDAYMGIEKKVPPVTLRMEAPIGVEYGWLHFTSKEAFEATMEMLHEKLLDQKDLQAWEQTYASLGFVSLRTRLETLEAEGDRAPVDADSLKAISTLLDCPDSRFATVVSANGRIQLGDTIYCYTNEGGWAVPARFGPAIKEGQSPSRIPGVQLISGFSDLTKRPQWPETGRVKTGEPIGPPSNICKYPNVILSPWWGQKGEDIYQSDLGVPLPKHNGRTVKLNYHRWHVNYGIYSSVGVRLKMWKDTRFLGWLSNVNADVMTMEACARGRVHIPGIIPQDFHETTFPDWPGFKKYSDNAFEKTLKWSALPGAIELDHFNFHFRVNYHGLMIERDIRE